MGRHLVVEDIVGRDGRCFRLLLVMVVTSLGRLCGGKCCCTFAVVDGKSVWVLGQERLPWR